MRRIDLLKQQADLMLLSKDQVRNFGKLTQTQTWEKAIAFYNSVDVANRWIEPVETSSFPLLSSSGSFVEWVGLPKLVGIFVVFVIAIFALRLPNPFLFFPPVRINIQIGVSK